MNIAIVGSGISGLGCAYALSKNPRLNITLFEKDNRLGGHSHTVDLSLGPMGQEFTYGVDTGFLVFNQKTYPNLCRLFDELGVQTAASSMSFAISAKMKNGDLIEWSGKNLKTLFAQKRRLLSPSFLRMVLDIIRFNALCTKIAKSTLVLEDELTIAQFLDKHHFSQSFRELYFLPMIGAIWSCSTEKMLDFPIMTMIRFCHNHGLIQIRNRPPWYTVLGGSKNYVKAIKESITERGTTIVHEKVIQVKRHTNHVDVQTQKGSHQFDHVIFATHTDQALELLEDPSSLESEILSAIRYEKNVAILHSDDSVLPKNQLCWSAWNYSCTAATELSKTKVCVHYLINHLQPLPKEWSHRTVVVSLNPIDYPKTELTYRTIEYDHPIFNVEALKAQQRLTSIQGKNRTWFCGAWAGYGFHEDGLKSGEWVAQAIHEMMSSNSDEVHVG